VRNLIKKILREDEWDWARSIKPMFNINNQPRRGDVLICLPGFTDSGEGPNYAGAGYYEGRIIVVGDVAEYPDDEEEKQLVIWPDVDESRRWWNNDYHDCYYCGVYGGYLKYYTKNINESEMADWEWDEVNNPLDGVKVKSPMGGVFTIRDNGGDYVDIIWDNGNSSTPYYRK